MNEEKRLKPEELRKTINAEALELPCDTELDDNCIGQERLKSALRELEIPNKHFHLFVAGPPGSGKTKSIQSHLSKIAPTKPPPPDICYIIEPDSSNAAQALFLKSGSGQKFKKDYTDLIASLKNVVEEIKQSELWQIFYKTTEEVILANSKNGVLKSKECRALKKKKIAITIDDINNFCLVFTKNGQKIVVNEAGFIEDWDGFTKKRIPEEKLNEKYHIPFAELAKMIHQFYVKAIRPSRGKLQMTLLQSLNELTACEIEKRFNAVKEPYPEVCEMLEKVKSRILEIVDQGFKNMPAQQMLGAGPIAVEIGGVPFVVGFVDNSETRGAPVIVLTQTTLAGLCGHLRRIETREGGGYDLGNIVPGALQKANGGYLIIDAENIFEQYFAMEVWNTLKAALKDEKASLANPRSVFGQEELPILFEPIPLNVKVILVGSKRLFSILNEHDPKFASLFNKAEIEIESRLTPELQKQIVLHLSSFSREKTKKPLTKTAIARLLEHGFEIAESQEKINMQLGILEKIIWEAAYVSPEKHEIEALDINAALRETEFRNNLIEERYFENIENNFCKIAVDGKKIGEINALAVMEHDNHVFGVLEKITANAIKTVKDEGDIVFVDQKAKLTGKIFDKAAEIISSWFKKTFFWEKFPYNVTISFEQSYGGIEGDSASIAKVAVIASEIQKVALRQDLSVTGSMNQKGIIQPIGSVNYKIKGFYKACRQRGLTGKQGVIIPKDNATDLMLPKEIIESVKEGKFHIYAVEKIEEALKILSND